jgi:RNA polymerase sigma factor (sigma-70 family)
MDPTPAGDQVADREASRARDAQLVHAALAGDQSAFGRLYDTWYDRVWNVALRIVHDREVAAEVAQDTFLSAWRNLRTLDNVDAFGGWLLRIARNASFNRARKEGRSSPVDDQGLTVIEASGASHASAPAGFGVEDRARVADDPEAVAADGELVALVRASAGALGPRDAEVLDLQLRYGLSPAEIGEVMGMNRNAANQLCHRIRQRFAGAVRARVLWKGDRPACDALAELLASAGIATFDGEAVTIADKHAEACDQCSERRELRLQPSAMFAAVPLVAAPVLLKQQTAHALEAAGVQMEGSAFGSAGSSGDGPGTDADGPTGDGDGDGRTGDGDGRRPGDGSSHRRLRRTLAMALVAAVVLVAAVAVLASRTHDATVDDLAITAGSLPTPTTTPATIAVETAPTEAITDASVEPPSTASTEPPADPSTTDTTPPAAPTIVFTLAPNPRPPTYVGDEFPILTWSVAGAASVRVEGPVDGEVEVLSSDPAGSLAVCAGLGSQSFCVTPLGSYDYVLTAFDGAGQVIGTRIVTLVIA